MRVIVNKYSRILQLGRDLSENEEVRHSFITGLFQVLTCIFLY